MVTSATPDKLHIHLGAGALGIGAVLPVLNRHNPLVVVQVARGADPDWGQIAKNSAVRLTCNPIGPSQIGFNASFRGVVAVGTSLDLDRVRPAGAEDRVLLVVEDFGKALPLLTLASSVSCSLKDGQSDLVPVIRQLRPVAGPIPLLAFENTPNKGLRQACDENTDVEFYNAVTDRLCVRRKHDPKDTAMVSDCGAYVSVIVGRSEGTIQALNQELLYRPTVGGIHFLERREYEEFHRLRKRWLVNSLHHVLAVLCDYALREWNLTHEKQFLPMIKAWRWNQTPEARHAFKMYVRLQALRLALIASGRVPSNQAALFRSAAMDMYGTDDCQDLFDTFVGEARDTERRFDEFMDSLDRLSNVLKVESEVGKQDEHVVEAYDFIETAMCTIRECDIYGRPDPGDLAVLQTMLTSAFLKNMSYGTGKARTASTSMKR